MKRSGYAKVLKQLESWSATGAAALYYIDLCHLASINRLSSPLVADQLILAVERQLKAWAGADGFSGRLWSDEFIAVKPLDHAQQAAEEAKSLRSALTSLRYTHRSNSAALAVSIGVVTLRSPIDWTQSLAQAEDANESAKQRGLNQIHFYNGSQPVRRQHDGSDLVDYFRHELATGSLSLCPQPILDIRSAQPRIAKAEFLLRIETAAGTWAPPPPGMIQALEQYRMSSELDHFSSRYLLAWLDDHRDALDRLDSVSFNLSAPSFIDGLFMGQLYDEVRHARLPAGKLCIEITETAAIENLDVAAEIILDFRRLGCHFSLDDFGSGLCSFGYLHALPVDEVKIDGGFIRDLANSSVSEKIVRAIHQVARATGKRTVAEFVDDPRKLAVLRDIGFDYAQGWLFYPSIPPEKLLELLALERQPRPEAA